MQNNNGVDAMPKPKSRQRAEQNTNACTSRLPMPIPMPAVVSGGYRTPDTRRHVGKLASGSAAARTRSDLFLFAIVIDKVQRAFLATGRDHSRREPGIASLL